MADNSYNVEIKLASSNGYFTPAESNAYYATRYARAGITVHWWGDGTGASNHDNIVNYMNAQAAAGNKSVNYVLSDNKITLCVSPDNVAFASNGGNPTTISVETQPTLNAEGYKKWGWLVDQLEQRYGRSLPLYKHSDWFATACPGTINLGTIRAEADKWKRGEYDAKPVPVVIPPVVIPKPVPAVTYSVTDIPNKKVRIKAGTKLWNLGFTKYANAQAVKTFDTATTIEVSAIAKHPLGSEYYLSEYSFAKGIGNGINVKDCVDVTTAPQPDVVQQPIPVPVPLTTEQRLSAIEAVLAVIKNILGIK